MSDDTVSVVRVNERWGLLAMVAVVAVAGGVIWWLGYWKKLEAPSTTLPAAATQKAAGGAAVAQDSRPRNRGVVRRPASEPQGDYVQWPDAMDNQGTTVIRVGNVYLHVSLRVGAENGKIVDVSWSDLRAGVGVASNLVMRVLADPRLAARYDFTAEQLEQLKQVKFTRSELPAEEHKKITKLFLDAAAARMQWRTQEQDKTKFVETELALKVAVGKLTLPPVAANAVDDVEEEMRKLLRPDQLDLIDSGFDRAAPAPSNPRRPPR